MHIPKCVIDIRGYEEKVSLDWTPSQSGIWYFEANLSVEFESRYGARVTVDNDYSYEFSLTVADKPSPSLNQVWPTWGNWGDWDFYNIYHNIVPGTYPGNNGSCNGICVCGNYNLDFKRPALHELIAAATRVHREKNLCVERGMGWIKT